MIEALLAGSRYFAGLSPEGRAALARACVEQRIERGETLFLEGQSGDAMFLLAGGRLQLLKSAASGQDVVVKTVEPGEVFGEVVLFERSDYPVSAVACEAGVLYRLPKHELLELLEGRAFRNDFIAALMKRMRYLADRILYLTAYDVEERFFRFLREQYGQRERYVLTLNRKSIAAAIGTTPESLSRLLARLKKEKLIELSGRRLHVPDTTWRGREA